MNCVIRPDYYFHFKMMVEPAYLSNWAKRLVEVSIQVIARYGCIFSHVGDYLVLRSWLRPQSDVFQVTMKETRITGGAIAKVILH